MTRHVAFLRAINVGGYALVKMADLRDAFAAAGCRNTTTYIQSGNVIFDVPADRSAAVCEKVRRRLRDLLGAEPDMCVRTAGEMERLVRSNPFKAYEAGPDVKLYVAFLAAKPRKAPTVPWLSTREAAEVVAIRNRNVFIVSRRKADGGYGFPNLFIEKALGVPSTTRNWNTVLKVVDLAQIGRR